MLTKNAAEKIFRPYNRGTGLKKTARELIEQPGIHIFRLSC